MRKKLLMIVFLICSLFIVGCEGFIITNPKTTAIEVITEDYEEVRIEDFDISNLTLLVIKSSGGQKEIPLTLEMIKEEDREKLTIAGTHTIKVVYDGVETSFTITLIESVVIEYTVIFKDYDGSILSEQKVKKGFSALSIDEPVRDQYVFTGWDVSFSNVQSDLVVNATYITIDDYRTVINSKIADLYYQEYSDYPEGYDIISKYSNSISTATTKEEIDNCYSLCEKELKALIKDVEKLLTISEVKQIASKAGASGEKVTFVGVVVGFDSMGYAHVGDETGLIYVRAKHNLLVKNAVVKITGYTTIYTGSSSSYPEYTRQIKADGIEISLYEDKEIRVKEEVVLDSSELIDNKDYVNADFHGNIVTISGIVEVGSSKYYYYLNDEAGNHIASIHHYSNGFEKFDNLGGKLVTLTGVIYRFYTVADVWTIQLIGLNDELVYTEEKLENTVNFVMINDTHGAFVDEGGYPGIARVSSVIDELEEKNGEYIKIANGDIFQGTYVSSTLYGRPLVDALNKIGFDAFVLGNHEFDWGLDKIAAYKDGNYENGEANFPFLGANVIDKKTSKMVEWLEPYVIISYGDYKVGIIGVIGESQESSILAENVQDYDFTDASDAVKKYAFELRNTKDCDVVVVASHDYDENTNYEIANFSGDYRIDAIFCAHTHQRIMTNISRNDGYVIPVMQNYDKNETMAEILLNIGEDNNPSSYYSSFYYPANYNADADLNSVIQLYQSFIDEGNRVLGIANYKLNKSVLGEYATDALVQEFKADIGIINTGGVRETISEGEITVSDVFCVFPFNNEVILTELSGSKVISLYSSNGSYLYFNSDFNVNSIVSTKTYKIAVIDYVFTGTYYKEFRNVEYTDTDIIMRDILIDYIDDLY